MSPRTFRVLAPRARLLIIILAVVCCSQRTSANHHQLSRTIQPNTDEETQQKAAMDVIRRLIDDKADDVAIKINFNLPGNYFKVRISASSMHKFSFIMSKSTRFSSRKLRKTNNSRTLRIEASNGVSACKALQHYLKHFCGAHVSWDGNQLPELDEFPTANIEMRASSEIIYYQNVCTHSYSFSWWSWSEWQRHIDWIAFSGIKLTLAPFQEDVWTEVFADFGLNQTDIDEHLAGPGFFAWQRMGNLRGWGGKLSPNFIKFSSDLQRRMIKALNELGISVALPAFDGHLPIHFRQLFPSANFSVVGAWNNFPPNYCCPLFVDPIEPLFQEIGRKFLQRMTEKYGTNHIYFSDPFNEVAPAHRTGQYLRDVSASIYAAMKSTDPKAIWLLQGWMFINDPLWTDELIEAFLTAVPKVS
jgi:alpha-N-acetylglucosaminidase